MLLVHESIMRQEYGNTNVQQEDTDPFPAHYFLPHTSLPANTNSTVNSNMA
jgi:hypothetical protein